MLLDINNQKKLENFTKVVLDGAIKKRDKIIQSLSEKKGGVIAQREPEFAKAVSDELKRQKYTILQQSSEQISRVQTECKRKLIIHRTQITNKVFNELKSRIDEFAKSEQYVSWLCECAKKAGSELGSCIIYISRGDEHLLSQVKSAIGGDVQVLEEKGFEYGIKAIRKDKKAIYYDTLLKRMDSQRDGFLKISGLEF